MYLYFTIISMISIAFSYLLLILLWFSPELGGPGLGLLLFVAAHVFLLLTMHCNRQDELWNYSEGKTQKRLDSEYRKAKGMRDIFKERES